MAADDEAAESGLICWKLGRAVLDCDRGKLEMPASLIRALWWRALRRRRMSGAGNNAGIVQSCQESDGYAS